jgi:hypothetical protein
MRHVAEQPSFGMVLPSSQVSSPPSTRSPQVTVQTLGSPVHEYPGSIMQVLLQPSLFLKLPSSQGSLPTRRESPQFGSHMLG